jgi:hypothetical protein
MWKSVPTQQAVSERLRVAEPQREFTPHVVSPLTSACPGRMSVTLMVVMFGRIGFCGRDTVKLPLPPNWLKVQGPT